MKIDVLTLFVDAYSSLKSGIIGKALDKELFDVNINDIRDYSSNKQKSCDDYPYGGGAGMVMTIQPIADCIQAIDREHLAKRIYMSPRGIPLTQSLVKDLSLEKHLLILSGSYEGVDQRVIDRDIDLEISIGDYITTSGDLPALVLINAVARYIPEVLGSSESVVEESFSSNLLEYPHYTRPAEYDGMKVPEVLLNGNHKHIEDFRKSEQIKITKLRRPDLLE